MPYCRWSARALVALLATAVAPPAMTHPPSPGEVLLAQLASAEEELLLEIEVNGATVSDVALLLRTADGRFLATAESLRSWRIRIPAVPVRDRAGAAWFPLDAVSGLSLRYDGTRQRLALTVPADAFESSRIDAARDALPQASVATPGGFLNYALTGTRGGGVSTYGALLEAGFLARRASSSPACSPSATTTRTASRASTPRTRATSPTVSRRCASGTRSAHRAHGAVQSASAVCNGVPTSRCSPASSRSRPLRHAERRRCRRP